MNQHILQGKWKEIRGGFKKQWGNLTDDDLKRIQGSLDQITGIVQQRYGYSKERAEQEISHYMDSAQEMGDRVKGYNDEIQSKVRDAVSDASDKLRGKPKRKSRKGWTALLAMMALVGVVVYFFNRQEKPGQGQTY